jgi:hypothetical protein
MVGLVCEPIGRPAVLDALALMTPIIDVSRVTNMQAGTSLPHMLRGLALPCLVARWAACRPPNAEGGEGCCRGPSYFFLWVRLCCPRPIFLASSERAFA